MTINLTELCNLRCSYCFYSGQFPEKRTHSSISSSFEDIKKAIDFFIPRLDKKKVCNFNFYGGEPFIEFNKLQKSIIYLKNIHGNKVNVTVTSNGTLITDEIIDFLKKENITIAISIDGPKEIHDENRRYQNGKGSFEDVFKLIKKLHNKHNKYFTKRVAFSIVITRATNPRELLDFFNENAYLFNKHTIKIVFENQSEQRICSQPNGVSYYLSDFLDIYKESIINKKYKFNVLDLLFKNQLYDVFYKKKKYHNYYSRICIPGNARVFVDSHMNFFACESMDGNYCLGNIKEGFDIKKIKKINIEYLRIMKKYCSSCWIKSVCGLCYAHACTSKESLSMKNFFITCNDHCKYFESLIFLGLSIIEKKGEQFFLDFLRGEK